ncbi:MAG: hypothetical protein ACR2RB_00700 [Gammaproteobacteria bacterium]
MSNPRRKRSINRHFRLESVLILLIFPTIVISGMLASVIVVNLMF